MRQLQEQLIHGPSAFTDTPRTLFVKTKTFSRAFKLNKSESPEDCFVVLLLFGCPVANFGPFTRGQSH